MQVLVSPAGTSRAARLRVAAASSEAAGLLELFQIQNDQGPCLDCFRTGRPVTAADLAGPDQRWPRFAAAATQAGFRTVEALPMRLRNQVIGALNLFRAGPGPLDSADIRLGQALADVATIGLLQERSVRRSETVAEQLQGALNSRVIIEQAKANSPSASASTAATHGSQPRNHAVITGVPNVPGRLDSSGESSRVVHKCSQPRLVVWTLARAPDGR
jgi:GAF domain